MRKGDELFERRRHFAWLCVRRIGEIKEAPFQADRSLVVEEGVISETKRRNKAAVRNGPLGS